MNHLEDMILNSCAIFGASGHGMVVAEIAELCGYSTIHFYDDRFDRIKFVNRLPVIGGWELLIQSLTHYDNVIIAIGDNYIRSTKVSLLKEAGATSMALVHPSAIVSQYSKVGGGTVVMANAVINPNCTIGDGCIINTSSSVDHDCFINDGVHISPGANFAGGVSVGNNTWIGIGSSIKQNVDIGRNVIVGAGSTVLSNIAANLTVIGSPAKPIDLE